uniref:Uncharacterized protein n=1 Tax=Arion vulgaris TaxID=1028688 RepID=A0A0B7AND6_9EUPU
MRLKKGMPLMVQVEKTVEIISTIDAISKQEEWVMTSKYGAYYLTAIITLGRKCREWCSGNADLTIN